MSRYIDADNLHNAKFQNTSGYDYGSAYRCGWNDAIDAICENEPTIDAASKWIPCSERFPSESGYYLSTIEDAFGDTEICVIWFAHSKDYNCESEWREITDEDTVLAWMPLPKPYGEREGE